MIDVPHPSELNSPARASYNWRGIGAFSISYNNGPDLEIEINPLQSSSFSIICPVNSITDQLRSQLNNGLTFDPNTQEGLIQGDRFVRDIYLSIHQTVMSRLLSQQVDQNDLLMIIKTVEDSREMFFNGLEKSDDPSLSYLFRNEVLQANIARMNVVYRAIEAKASQTTITMQQMLDWIDEFGQATAIAVPKVDQPQKGKYDEDPGEHNGFSTMKLYMEDSPIIEIDPQDFFLFADLIRSAYGEGTKANMVKVQFEFDERKSAFLVYIADNGNGLDSDNLEEDYRDPESRKGRRLMLDDLIQRMDSVVKEPALRFEVFFTDPKDPTIQYITYTLSYDLESYLRTHPKDLKRALPIVTRDNGKSNYHSSPNNCHNHGKVISILYNLFEITERKKREMIAQELLPREVDQRITLTDKSSMSVRKDPGELQCTVRFTIGTETTELELPLSLFTLDPKKDDLFSVQDIIEVLIKHVSLKKYGALVQHALRNYATPISGNYTLRRSLMKEVPEEKEDEIKQEQNAEIIDMDMRILGTFLQGYRYIDQRSIPADVCIRTLIELGILNGQKERSKDFEYKGENIQIDAGVNPIVWLHLLEIIRNSQKETFRADRTIFRSSLNNGMIQFGILDNGIGFERETIQEKFYGLSSTTGSTGLGCTMLNQDITTVKDLQVVSWRMVNGTLDAFIYSPRMQNQRRLSEQELKEFTSPYTDKLPENGSLLLFRSSLIPNGPETAPQQ